MNKYNGLLSSVAHKYHICKGARETENEWKTRLVYSICGMMAYASLWDDSEEGTISIVHLKRKVRSMLANYKSMYPELSGSLPYEPLTEEERKYARNPLTHVDFLLFNQMDKQPVLAIEVDGTGFHEAGSKQAERDIKKNSILKKCAISLLRLRTDGSGEREKIRTALKRK